MESDKRKARKAATEFCKELLETPPPCWNELFGQEEYYPTRQVWERLIQSLKSKYRHQEEKQVTIINDALNLENVYKTNFHSNPNAKGPISVNVTKILKMWGKELVFDDFLKEESIKKYRLEKYFMNEAKIVHPVNDALEHKAAVSNQSVNIELPKHKTLDGNPQYYLLYYGKEYDCGKAFVEIEKSGNQWLNFTLVNFIKIAANGPDKPENYTADKEYSSVIVPSNEHQIYVLLKRQQDSQSFYHFYNFNCQKENLQEQKIIFGTYSRKKHSHNYPVVGICMLIKCESNNREQEIDKLKNKIPVEVENLLIGRRLGLHGKEHDVAITDYPNEKAVEIFRDLAGTWEGIHFDSNLDFGPIFQTGYLRSCILKIEESGRAKILYHNKEADATEIQVLGFFKFFNIEHDVKNLFGEFELNTENELSRLVISLEIHPSRKILKGCFGGVSDSNKKPYAGAIAFTKNDSAKIRNIPIPKQNYLDHHHLLDSLVGTNEEYINLPEQCLSRDLHSYLDSQRYKYPENTIKGHFTAYSLTHDKKALVAYPMTFGLGLCTVYAPNEKTGNIEPYHSRIVDDKEQHVIWLDFTKYGKGFGMFQYDSGNILIQKSFVGISLRNSQKGKIQAKREVIIRSKQIPTFRVYSIDSDELNSLIKKEKALEQLLGREYNLIQVPSKKSDKLQEQLQRRDFKSIFLFYAVKCYLEDDNQWEDYLEQSMLHGEILTKFDIEKTIRGYSSILKKVSEELVNDFKEKFKTFKNEIRDEHSK